MKGDKLYVKWKGCDNSFNSWQLKKIFLYKMSYFPEPYTRSRNKIEVELDLSKNLTKSDLKMQLTGNDTSDFAKMVDLANLKSSIDESDISKLKTTFDYIS